MNEIKSQRLYTRVTPREKEKIIKLAEKCGLSQSEYLRKRALGYAPKQIMPDAFYDFSARLDRLCNIYSGRVSDDTESRLLDISQAIQKAFLTPEKENARQINAGLIPVSDKKI